MSRRLKQTDVVFIIVFAGAPGTRLSAQDIETICVAARQDEANTADGRRER